MRDLFCSSFGMRIRVYDDEEEWFRSIFANSNKEDAIQNQYEFFVQRMGGPPIYSQRKGDHDFFFHSVSCHWRIYSLILFFSLASYFLHSTFFPNKFGGILYLPLFYSNSITPNY